MTLHSAAVVLPITAPPLTDGSVLVEGDRIAAVGPRAELVAAYPGVKERRWPGVLTPGLVNAHTHLQFTDDADLAESGLDFFSWIRTLTARAQQRSAAEWQESARHGVHQLLSSGTTCAADVVTHAPALVPPARAGLAGISYLELVGLDATSWPSAREQLAADLAAAPIGRTLGLAPHTLYTVDIEVVREIADLAREYGMRLHVHAAETDLEVDFVTRGEGPFTEVAERLGWDLALHRLGGSGRTPVAELAEHGCVAADCHLAHGVHVDATDRALLRENNTAVALCTRSNGILGAGEAPVADYLREGNPIAVGTDSRASSPDLDLLAELRALRDLAVRQGYADADVAERLVRAATTGGAAALGLDDVGRITVGARADLAVFAVPTDGDPCTALVDHGAGACVATVLGGTLVHRRSVESAA